MNAAIRTLGTAAVAAAAMYWMDPASGRRRRARLRDKLVSTAGDVKGTVDAGGRDLAHRVRGLAARVRSASTEDEVSDAVLSERVRACLGRVVSHPGAIEVHASQGRVVMSGEVLAREYQPLLRAIEAVRGVEAVEDRLGIHDTATGISALQGGRPRRSPRFELLQERWSPGARLVTSAVGGALLVNGLMRSRTVLGLAGAATGGALLARSALNVPLKRIAGVTGRRGIEVRKTLHVLAPVEQVFQTLSFYENFPLFMRNVRSVRMHADGRSHWSVAGPGGITLQWDAVTTRLEPNRLLAWRTVASSAVQHAGVIRFEPEDSGTHLDIRMSYNPPGGVLGHAMARLFGADPKSELDQDLLRLKSFLETGKSPRDAAAHGTAHTPAESMAAQSPTPGEVAPEPAEGEQPLH